MANARVWAIKGVSDRTRDAVVEMAQDAGLTIGEWVDQALARAAEEARNPRPPAATREDVAELIDARLKPGEEALGRLEAQLAALEEKVSRRTEAGPAPARAKAPARNQGRPRLRLPEPGAR
jgi:hypothetical protein